MFVLVLVSTPGEGASFDRSSTAGSQRRWLLWLAFGAAQLQTPPSTDLRPLGSQRHWLLWLAFGASQSQMPPSTAVTVPEASLLPRWHCLCSVCASASRTPSTNDEVFDLWRLRAGGVLFCRSLDRFPANLAPSTAVAGSSPVLRVHAVPN